MKIHFVLLVVTFFSHPIFGFISYPFEAKVLLASLLDSIHLNPPKITLKNSIPGEQCRRSCKQNDEKICHFKFTLEFYQILGGACNDCLKSNNTDCFNLQCITGDGIERTFMSINRQLPGPEIQVCKNDVIIVDVSNEMEGTATSIHWHGLLQHETPYSDGVPFLTQCPISYGTEFRYVFKATEKGTNLYHSHAGLHKANGLYGALIVRDFLSDENEKLYDFDLPDFYILCSDWMHVFAEDFFPGLPSTISLFDSILINGHGRFFNKTSKTHVSAPLKIYSVERQKRYLFRLINAASNVCPFQVQIEHHSMTIISTDGNDINPINVDNLFITSGERFDFVVITKNVSSQDYFIRIRALSPCNDTVEGFAVLRYADDDKNYANFDFVSRQLPKATETYDTERNFNFPGQDGVKGSLLTGKSINASSDVIKSLATDVFYFFLATPKLDNSLLFKNGNHRKYMVTSNKLNNNNIATMNNISLSLPKFPLLLNKNAINESIFCENCMNNATPCECIHRVKVNLNSIVEIVLIDIEDNSRHPFHLHGHKFYVMDSGKFNDENLNILDFVKERKTNENEKPMLKDTVTVPSQGFVKIKFKADNPGFWLAHCHFDYHLAVGMGFILQVGEVWEMKGPLEGMDGKCGNFIKL